MQEVNTLIPDTLPFIVSAGEVAKVTARVPFPNLWSDPLSLTVDSLTLDVSIIPQDKAKQFHRSESQHRDLASSVTSAADDFVHSELDAFEGAELDRSIRESLVLNQTDPFADDVPGGFPGPSNTMPGGGAPIDSPLTPGVESTTVLATLVERILARLECKVKNVRIRVHFPDQKYGGILELRIGEVRYCDETPEDPAAPRQTIRVVTVSGVDVHVLPLSSVEPPVPPPRAVPPMPSVYRTVSTSSEATSATTSSYESEGSSNDEFHDMVMSQAVADLRQSVVIQDPPEAGAVGRAPGGSYLSASAMSSATGRSIYHSMVEDPENDPFASEPMEKEPSVPSILSSPRKSPSPRKATPPPRPPTPPRRMPTPPPPRAPSLSSSVHSEAPSRTERTSRTATPTPGPEFPEIKILSFGSEDILVRMKTTYPAVVIPSGTAPEGMEQSQPPAQPVEATPSLPAFELDVSMGTLTAVLLPRQMSFLLALAQSVIPSSQPSGQAQASAEPPAAQPRSDIHVHLKALYAAFVYDVSPLTDEAEASIAQFYQRPAANFVQLGHLRLRFEDVAALYTVAEQKPAPPRRRNEPRRKSPSPQPPQFGLTVADASLFEFLSSAESGEDEPPGGIFPVLIFDANLPKQYEVPPGAPSSLLSTHSRSPANQNAFPEFDAVDWRNAGVQKKSGEKAWRVRPRGKGILRGVPTTPEPTGAQAIVIKKELRPGAPALVELLPVHCFLDLSLVERLLPVLRSLAPCIRSSGESDKSSSPSAAHRPELPQFKHYHQPLLPGIGRPGARPVQRPNSLMKLACPMIRLDIRCPAPVNRRGSWGDGAHLRSGIVTLDIHGLSVNIAEDPPATLPQARRPSQGSFEPDPLGGTQVEWQTMLFLFSRAPERRTSAFLIIGPLAPEPGEDDGLLLPKVHVHSELSPVTGLRTKSVTCKVPSVQAKIRQPTVEGLQFFADDMTHWLDGAFGDGSAPKPRDDLKMIGSRFFGSKASSSTSSSMADEEEDDPAATLLRVLISEAEVTLVVPRSLAPPPSTPPSTSEDSNRILSLRASDLDVKLESNLTHKQETAITVTTMDADLFHHAYPEADAARIFGRTTPLTLTTHTQPIITLRFSTLTHQDRTKETGIRLITSACTVFVTKDLEWVQDLARYAKTPEGVFEDVVPSEVTKIQLAINDCSIHIATPTLPGAVLLIANVLDVRTVLESEGMETNVDVGLSGGHLLAIDDLEAATPLQMGHQLSLEAWKRAGYAQLVELVTFDTKVTRSLVPNETVLIDILQSMVRVTACADSLATIGALAGDLSKLGAKEPEPEELSPKRRPVSLDQTIDVFGSVDMQAFTKAPDIISGADMIEDDLPTDLDYLDHAARQSKKTPHVDNHTGESLRSWETPDEDKNIAEHNGGTIKILMTEPFKEEPNYWNNLPVVLNSEETRLGKTRIRVQNTSVTVFLHEGYDWVKTRKAIEDEMKAVRKKLEKIKQLLASGQKPDASIDQASSVLFNSVYIGLDQNRDDMDSTQLLAAIDEELEDLGGENWSESSWQTFPEAAGLPSPQSPQAAKRRVRLHGKRLTRSKRPQIEFSLRGLRADVDMYGKDDSTSSRLHLTAQSFDILDHIKTSTWKKFLTEMKSDSRGNVRETDADMVRVEVISVRPHLPSPDEEIRVRVSSASCWQN